MGTNLRHEAGNFQQNFQLSSSGRTNPFFAAKIIFWRKILYKITGPHQSSTFFLVTISSTAAVVTCKTANTLVLTCHYSITVVTSRSPFMFLAKSVRTNGLPTVSKWKSDVWPAVRTPHDQVQELLNSVQTLQ